MFSQVIGVIAEVEIFVAVQQAYFRIGFHVLFDDLHPLVPRPDHDRVDDLLFFGDGERRHVPVGTSREAQHHRIVSFVDAARRYVEHFRRFDRNVVFRIRGGLSVFVAVYAV